MHLSPISNYKKAYPFITLMIKQLFLTMLLIFIISCSNTTVGNGYLEGKVSIGPLCPVERDPPDPSCMLTKETYDAWPLYVFDDGNKLAKIEPDAEGYFRVELPPGNYVVDLDKETRFRGGLPVEIVIKSDEIVKLEISLDTGIR